MEEVPIQKPLNKQVLMTEISPDHPNFLLMKNFQEILIFGREITLSWIHFGCVYRVFHLWKHPIHV